jgi:hypothetical protein
MGCAFVIKYSAKDKKEDETVNPNFQNLKFESLPIRIHRVSLKKGTAFLWDADKTLVVLHTRLPKFL